MMWRNPLQPYSPAVLALCYACLFVAFYAFALAISTPVATWEDEHE
ncbi:MAG: hypothetical protein K2R93_12210 [Gemmatimonadaceae bacterium]|nr:hypothetical protein [Gemmatimonadaceae bacterium]